MGNYADAINGKHSSDNTLHDETDLKYAATGDTIYTSDSVIVADPTGDDDWNHSFIGRVDGFRNGLVEVVDQEDNRYSVEPEKLTLEQGD